ncbi:MAG TPA: CapA family protein, partial [Pseudogracilibacillus sp.]|nr:CapA family protein [Pseudogracilibacillus sp.]
MNKKLNFKELLLRYMKRNKRRTDKQAILLAFVLAIVLIITGFSSNNFIKDDELKPIQAEKDAITFGFTGDMMLGRFVNNTVKRYDPSVVFLGTGIDMTSLDYLTGNFEHPIIDDEIKLENKEREKIYLSADEAVLDIIKQTGFTNVNLANNHMGDYGEEGILHTVDAFQKADIPFVGAGENRSDAYKIHYEEIKGKTIATIGFTEVYTRAALTGIDTPGVATSNMKIMLNKVYEASKYADVVITHIHWGTEYKTKYDKRQKQIAEVLADAGVDVIIGHHPHVLQTVDIIDNTIVFYSLGNFIFDQGWSMTRETVFPVLTMQKDG